MSHVHSNNESFLAKRFSKLSMRWNVANKAYSCGSTVQQHRYDVDFMLQVNDLRCLAQGETTTYVERHTSHYCSISNFATLLPAGALPLQATFIDAIIFHFSYKLYTQYFEQSSINVTK